MMKKFLFCLSLGLMASGCQNGAFVPEGDVRTNFSSYCKLTGGTPQGTNVCICGNYRCYERACNHDANQCDDRLCYDGDTKCTNSDDKTIGGKIQICSDRQWIDYGQNKDTKNSGNPTIENVNAEGYCAQNNDNATNNLSCTIPEHHWEAKCGECLNGDYKCTGVEDQNETGIKYYLYQCNSGKYQNVAICKDGCRKDAADCQSCEEYCVNDAQTTIGKYHRCDSTDNKNCQHNASCTYNDDGTSECGTCRNITCENIPDTPYYISVKRCENGKKIEQPELAAHVIYSDKDCSQAVNNNLCLRFEVTDNSITKDSIMHYNCNNGTSCFLSGCEYDCSVEKGCLEENAKGECNDDNDQSNCQITNSCFCNNNNDCSHCINCKEEDGNHCICSDNLCVPVPKCDDEPAVCPEDTICSSVGTCVSDCNDSGFCNTADCDKLQCTINEQKATVYCDISKANLDYSDPSIYPFIAINNEKGSELHINSKNIDLLYNLSKLDPKCTKISTIVLHGDRQGNFEINCEKEFTSISLPENIKMIRGELNDKNEYPVIQCNANTQDNSLKKPLFVTLKAMTLENFGIDINFDLSETSNTGGLANTIQNSILNNISIAGSVNCSNDNCGLLAGTVSGTSLDIKGIQGGEINVIPIDDNHKLTNIGGVIGLLQPSNSHIIKFNNIHINNVTGTYNVGGFIGSIGCPEVDSCESSTSNITIKGTGNTLTGTVNGMKNVGGVIGAASGLLHVTDFGLNENDNNKTPNGIIIGGNVHLYEQVKENKQNYEIAYRAENIGGLIGKLVIPEKTIIEKEIDLNTPVSTIKNIIVKLSAVTCSEYNHRSEIECSDNSCDNNELCNKHSSQCKYGAGLVGFMDIKEIANAKEKVAEQINKIDKYTDTELEKVDVPKINNTILDISNVLLVLDTLSISRYYAGLVGQLGDDPEEFDDTEITKYINKLNNSSLTSLAKKEIAANELANIKKQYPKDSDYHNQLKERLIQKFDNIIQAQLRHKYGILSIENVLIAINEVNGRLDIFGRFRGFANNIRVLTELQMSKIFALIKLNDNPENNYCLYKGEYDGKLATSYENKKLPCLISSAKTASNSNCSPSKMSDFSCSSCVSQYLENYNFFLVYAPECRFTDGDGNFADEKGNPYDRFCYIDKKSLFTMSDNYKDSNARDLSEEKVKKQSVYFYQFKHYSTYYRPTYFTYDDDGKQSMHKHYDIVYGQCITNEASDNYMCAYLQNDCGASLNLYCCDSSTGGHCNANSKDVCTGAPSKTHYTCSDIHALDNFNWSGSDTFYIEGKEFTLPTPI